MKKLKWLFIAIPLFVIILIVSPFIISPITNNFALRSFSNQLDSLPKTAVITFVEKQSICGKLNGNGNGMDFLACMLVKSNLTSDELFQIYDNLNYKTAKNNSNSIVDFEVVPMQSHILKTQYLEHGEIIFNSLKNVSDISNYYALIIYDGGYSANFDIRGH